MLSAIGVMLGSAVVSAIVSVTLTICHFKVLDSYVKEVVELAKKYMADAYTNRDKH